uniref:G_PROTEIN_RECEP_F1_2 domain-containing protein n=1 Tax=Panagrellus redivivus TaxID=6233 RepID=A0A7E4W699_PANRE
MENIGVHFTEDYVEIGYLTVIIFFGLVLNTGVFVQLMRQSRTPTASTSFLTGPYQLSSFNLFKVHLCITDFGILLVHALGKLIWIYTLEWHMGGYYGCKAYQFFSAFTYYANSNVVVSIGLDRLKVVYTSHIQGATSVRRVRWMLAFSWTIAAICSLPQLYVWETIIFTNGNTTFQQCTTIWQVRNIEKYSFLNIKLGREKVSLISHNLNHAFPEGNDKADSDTKLPMIGLLGSFVNSVGKPFPAGVRSSLSFISSGYPNLRF